MRDDLSGLFDPSEAMSEVEPRHATQIAIVLIVSVALAIVSGRGYVWNDGYVFLAEQFEVASTNDFWRVAYPTWDEQLQAFPFAEQPKVYYYALLTFLGSVTGSFKFLQSIALLSPLSVGFVSAFVLNRFYIGRLLDGTPYGWDGFFCACFSAFLFVVNPWFAMNPRNLVFRLQFALLPLLVYSILRLVDERRPVWAILFAFAAGFVASYRFTVILTLLVGLIAVVHAITSRDPRRAIVSNSLVIGGSYVLFLLLSAARFLPSMLYLRRTPIRAVESFSPALIQREPILNIFTTRISTWTAVNFELVYADGAHFLFLVVAVFSLSSLVTYRRDQFPAFFHLLPAVVIVFFVLLSAREANLDAILLQLPYARFHGRLLRHARWNAMPVVLAFSMLSGFAAIRLIRWRVRPSILVITCITLLAAGSAWPLFSGDMNGYWNPNPPPEDYVEVNEVLLEEQATSSVQPHAVWVPGHLRKATWSAQTGVRSNTAPTGLYPVRSASLPSYEARSRYFFDYYWPADGGPSNSGQPTYAGNFSRVYGPLHIEYVTFHSDEALPSETRDSVLENDTEGGSPDRLADGPEAETVYSGENLESYRLGSGSGTFTVRRPVDVRGGLPVVSSAATAKDGMPPGIRFTADGIDDPRASESTTTLVINEPGYLVTPSEATITLPASSLSGDSSGPRWTATSVDSPSFQDHLADRGIPWSWQFGYGSGVLVTDSSTAVPEGVSATDTDRVDRWTFDSEDDLSAWEPYAGGSGQSVELDDSRLNVSLSTSSWGWRTVDSPPVEVAGSGVYRFSFEVRGDPAHQVHAKVVERGRTGDLLEVNQVATIGNGSFGPREVGFDYQPRNQSVHSIQLSIWHGHQTAQPLPNTLFLDDVTVSNVSAYARPVERTGTVRVEDAGRYHVFVRALENRDGGGFTVAVDGDRELVETERSLDKMAWKSAGTHDLDTGTHRITVTNRYGFNAVNLVVLQRVDDASETTTHRSIRNRYGTIAHVLEAESDFETVDGAVVERTGSSNGRGVNLSTGGTLSTPLRTSVSGRYRFAVKGEGSLRVQVDGETLRKPEERGRFTYFDAVTLSRGTHRLTITGDSVDVVWLYTTPDDTANRTLQDVFAAGEAPASVESVERIDATRYEVDVNASGPYMLSFAEGYDPLWVAEVETEDGTKQVEPTRLYGVTNGFWIEESGDYTVTVRYRPQRWFHYGATVSGATFVLCVIFLLYDWRRRRGDEWAVGAHDRFHARWADVRRRVKGAIVRSARRLAE